MDRFMAWWKKDKRRVTLIKALLMALLPALCCLTACAVQGKSIGDVYLPASEWNDELFYFKQVEGIVNFGCPRGYFGFNESHALKLSFAAWSPALVFPWVLWGIFFGWNLLSPVVCNILLMTLAVFLFVWLVRPSWKQMGVLTLLFCLYTLFVRYMLSGMPEAICFSLLILFYGLAVNYLERERGYKLALLFVISGALTLMRPYMLLFMLLPGFLWFRRQKWKGALGSAVVTGAVLGCYALVKHYFGAEYFAPLFFTDWITAFVEEGIGGGIRNFFGTLYWMGRGFLADTVQGFRSGLAAGAFFGGYLAVMAVLLWQTFVDFGKYRRMIKGGRRGDVLGVGGGRESGGNAGSGNVDSGNTASGKTRKIWNRLLIEGHLAFCFVGMLFALLLMYKLTEGSKHLLTFIAAGIFVVSLMETKTYKKAALLGAVFAYLYTYKAVDPYDYQVPFAAEEIRAQVEEWRMVFDGGILLEEENAPSFDNVIIWVFSDETPEGVVITKWQLLYALPEGMGISCCMSDYATEHFGELQSRYIALPAGGELDAMCRDAGYVELGRDGDLAVYARY